VSGLLCWVLNFLRFSFISVSLFDWQKETLGSAAHSNMLNIISFIAIKFIGDFAENLSVKYVELLQ